MSSGLSRRDFLNHSLGLSAGAVLTSRLPISVGGLSPSANPGASTPMVITSHPNQTGQEAMRQAWEILAQGGTALDAVERGANVIEIDPEDTSVGYGGLPNEEGVVQLDASIMDGRTYSAGSVAGLENIKTPSSVARMVMERTDHVMLVSHGALEFARSLGFEETDLMTEKSRRIWLRWREERSDRDDWGPPEHLKDVPGTAGGARADAGVRLPPDRPEDAIDAEDLVHRYGTTNVLAVDANGDVAGITTTSGLAFKIPGRIGDSPIIGAGLYVDNEVGAAGATGRGEDVIKSCASFYMVMRMRDGLSPQEACEDALRMIISRYRHVNPDFKPSEKFVAINKAGEYGCATMISRGLPRMSVRNESGLEIFEGTTTYTMTGQ
jgi:N4-(beta-N-acetylglucosaminyl)-L-asparaginase